MSNTPHLAFQHMLENQANKEQTYNLSMTQLDIILNGWVASMILNSPPSLSISGTDILTAANNELQSTTTDKFINVLPGMALHISGFTDADINRRWVVASKTDNQTLVLSNWIYTLPVEAAGNSISIVTPVEGDAYIVAANPSSDWVNMEDKVTYYFNGWRSIQPVNRMKMYEERVGLTRTWDDGAQSWG